MRGGPARQEGYELARVLQRRSEIARDGPATRLAGQAQFHSISNWTLFELVLLSLQRKDNVGFTSGPDSRTKDEHSQPLWLTTKR